MFIRVVSDYFVVGIDEKNNIIVEAPPIIRWAKGKNIIWFLHYCKHKQWKVQKIQGDEKVSI